MNNYERNPKKRKKEGAKITRENIRADEIHEEIQTTLRQIAICANSCEHMHKRKSQTKEKSWPWHIDCNQRESARFSQMHKKRARLTQLKVKSTQRIANARKSPRRISEDLGFSQIRAKFRTLSAQQRNRDARWSVPLLNCNNFKSWDIQEASPHSILRTETRARSPALPMPCFPRPVTRREYAARLAGPWPPEKIAPPKGAPRLSYYNTN